MKGTNVQKKIFIITEIVLFALAVYSACSLLLSAFATDNYVYLYENLYRQIPRIILFIVIFFINLFIYIRNRADVTEQEIKRSTLAIAAVLVVFAVAQSVFIKCNKDSSVPSKVNETLKSNLSISEFCNYDSEEALSFLSIDFKGAYSGKSDLYLSDISKTTDGESIKDGFIAFSCCVYSGLPYSFEKDYNEKTFRDLLNTENFHRESEFFIKREYITLESGVIITKYFSEYSETDNSKKAFVLASLDDKSVLIDLVAVDKNHNLSFNEDNIINCAEKIITELP